MTNAAWPATSWQAAFNADPNDPLATPTWDDITPRVTKWNGQYGRQYELDTPQAGTTALTCRDADEYLNPLNTASPYNSAGKLLLPYRQIRRLEAWPLTGNLLNNSNSQWGVTASDGTFEDGTVGHWIQNGGAPLPVLTNDTAHAHSGTKALKGAFAAAPGAFAGCALPGIVVIPGVQTTVSIWVYMTGSLNLATIAIAGFGAGTNTATLGSYVRLSQTLTPSASTIFASMIFGGTGAGSFWIDDVQVEFGATPTTNVSTGPIIYPTFTGYIERYPQRWEKNGYEGWSELTAVDALTLLATVDFADCMTEDVQQDLPGAAYALTEAAGAAGGANSSATVLGLMTAQQIGVGGTFAFAGGNGPGPDALPAPLFTPVDASNGIGLSALTPGGIGAGPGASLEAWFKTTTVSRGIAGAYGIFNPGWQIRLDASGHVVAEETENAGSSFGYTITSPAIYTDNVWHHVVVTETYVPSVATATLYVDGVNVGSSTRVASTAFVAYALAGASTWYPAIGGMFAGQIARIAYYPTALSAGRVQSHFLAGYNGFSGDLTGARINRLLGWVPWNGTSAIDPGHISMGPAVGLAGMNARDGMQQCADTDNGLFYAAPSGALTFLGSDAYYLKTTSSFTFGENETGGEKPYGGDIAFDWDPTRIGNQVSVTRNNGTTAMVVDGASIKHYFPRSLTRTIYADNDDAARTLAQRLINLYKDVHNRVSVLVISPAANPLLWPTALGTKVGDRVTVTRRTVAGTFSADYFIEQVAPAAGKDSYLVGYAMSPVPAYTPWIIGDATYGVVGTTTIPVYSDALAGALAVAVLLGVQSPALAAAPAAGVLLAKFGPGVARRACRRLRSLFLR